MYAPEEGNFYYVLQIMDFYPPEPQALEEVRQDVAKRVFELESKRMFDDWIAKLKKEYPVRIYLADPCQQVDVAVEK